MTKVFIGIWIIGASLCLAEVDDFNSPSLNTNKWGLTSEYSANFVHTDGYISFESTTEHQAQWGYIYWKEKMSLSNNWNAKVQAFINPSFRPFNNLPQSELPIDNPYAPGGEVWLLDRGTGTGVLFDGMITAAIGVTDNPNRTDNANAYAHALMKGSNNKKYFNTNYDINASHLGLNLLNTDLQLKEISTDKVILELGYDSSTGSLYSKMFDFSDNTFGSLLYQDAFKIKLTQSETLSDFDLETRDIIINWESISDVYVFAGGDTYYSEAPLGSATLDNFEIVPEPSALSLLAVGLGGLAMLRRRRS